MEASGPGAKLRVARPWAAATRWQVPGHGCRRLRRESAPLADLDASRTPRSGVIRRSALSNSRPGGTMFRCCSLQLLLPVALSLLAAPAVVKAAPASPALHGDSINAVSSPFVAASNDPGRTPARARGAR